MGTDRLEAHRKEEIDWGDATFLALALLPELRVAERLDGLHATLGQVARDPLDQHPPEPTPGERGHHVGGHE
jgi:hypothetical protein